MKKSVFRRAVLTRNALLLCSFLVRPEASEPNANPPGLSP